MCTINGISMLNKWHNSGDVVELKSCGDILFKHRISETRILKKFGQKISLSQIENAALKNTLVENCLAVSNVTNNFGIVLFICSSSNLLLEDLEVEIFAYLQKVLLPVFVPNAVIAVKKFKLTRHGKIDQKCLLIKAKKWLQRSKIKSAIFPKCYEVIN